jgi:hypothetical protein
MIAFYRIGGVEQVSYLKWIGENGELFFPYVLPTAYGDAELLVPSFAKPKQPALATLPTGPR